MEFKKCAVVQESDLAYTTQDARLVAIRWDLIPWSLVFDLDSPIAEGTPVIMKRTWLCFHHVGEVTVPWEKVNLPTGCWLTSTIRGFKKSNGLFELGVIGATFQYDGDQIVPSKKSREIVIEAGDVMAVASLETAEKGEYGLDREVRQGLATDEDLLEILETSLAAQNE